MTDKTDSARWLLRTIALCFVLIIVVLLSHAVVTAYNGYKNYQAAQAYIEGLRGDGGDQEQEEAQGDGQGQS